MAALFNVILRKATYHFRRRVPDDLRPSLGRRELVRSLATSDPRTAKLRACRLYVASENLFSVLRTTPMLTQAQLAQMVQDFYTQLLGRGEELRRSAWSKAGLGDLAVGGIGHVG